VTGEELLAMIVERQAHVIVARRERAHTERRLGQAGATWADLTARIQEVEDTVNERDRWLNAAVWHEKQWAHIFDDCPICQPRSQE
jgi:hypothetical protein